MTIRKAAPTEKSNLASASSEALPTSQEASEPSDAEFAFVPDQVPSAAPSSNPTAVVRSSTSTTVPSFANEKQAYKLSYAPGTSPFAAGQTYANRPAAIEPMELGSIPSSPGAIPVVPARGKRPNPTEAPQVDAHSSEFADPGVTTNANVYKSSGTDFDIPQAFVVDDTDCFAVPPGKDEATNPPKRCSNVVIACLVGLACVVILIAIIVPIVVTKSSSSSSKASEPTVPSSPPSTFESTLLYFAEYKLTWQVQIVGGSFYYDTFNHALEISCPNGGTVSDAKITSYVSGVSPTCNLLDSSLNCKQASSPTIDTDGNVLSARFLFTCSGKSREELAASATMAAQYFDVTTNTTAFHFLTLNILDSAGNADFSDSRCPAENWMLSSDSSTLLCAASATCYDETCTLELPSLTISQGSPVNSTYVQDI